MPRSLPLGSSDQVASAGPSAGPSETESRLAGTVSVHDPAMCCPTGVCGPGVDPTLLTIARDLRWLEKQGVTVQRFGLAQEPGAFVSSPRVAGLMQAFGDGALPAVLVNGDVLSHGRYPTRDELVAALRAAESTPAPGGGGSSCCTPGSGCC